MKVITKENDVIVYIVEDTTVITQDDNQTYIGMPVDCYFPEVTVSNSVVHEGVVNIPSEVRPNLYFYNEGAFFLNNDNAKVKSVRSERNTLLSETDWWMLKDQNPTQEQLDYRQALRDVPSQVGFPSTVVWPVKP